MYIWALVFEFLEKHLEHFFELIWVPIQRVGLSNGYRLKRVDYFLAQLAIRRTDADLGIDAEYLIDGVKGFDIGEDTEMRRFAKLWLWVAQIDYNFLEQLGADIILNIFGVEVDYLEDEHRSGEIDFFLC